MKALYNPIVLIFVSLITINRVYAEDLILENQTISLHGSHTYSLVRLTNSTINVTPYTGYDDGRGFLRIYADSIFIDINSAIRANGAGGVYDSSFAGAGNSTGYGGAGYGGAGGDGGDNTGSGGSGYGSNSELNLGSRGSTNNPAQTEGAGGGAVQLNSHYIQINGEVSANGNNGAIGSHEGSQQSGGKGGGSGGHLIVMGQTIIINGVLSVHGGNGGNAGILYSSSINPDGGGGGSGGRILISAASIINNSAIFNLDGGQGGTGHLEYGGVNGFFGEDGELEIKITPNWIISTTHPVAALWYINPAPQFVLHAGANVYGYFYEVDQDSTGSADLTSSFTQLDTLIPGMYPDGTWYFHCLPMDSNYQTIDSLSSSFRFNIKTVPPVISSPSHPNQNYFYTNANPSFIFEQRAGISHFYYSFNQNPDSTPDSLSGTYHSSNTLLIPGVSDGTYWLSLVGIDNVGFVGQTASHYRINVGSPQPIISYSADSLQFGLVTIGQSASLNVTIYNLGNGTLDIDSLFLTDTLNFRMSPANFSGNIPAGDSLTVEITFQPQDTLWNVDTLMISSNDPVSANAHLILTGQGSELPTEYIYLDIPQLEVLPNDTFLIPLNVQFPPDRSFSSAELRISGYFDSLIFLGFELNSTLMGDASWIYEYNETDTLLITAFAGSEELSGSGELLKFRFRTPPGLSGFVPINLNYGKFNSGGTATSLNSGGVNILTPEYGDVDLNGVVEAYDASLVLQYIVGSISLDEHQYLNANVSLDTTVSALDASLILQFVVSLLDSLPYDTTENAWLASGTLFMSDGEAAPGEPVEVPIYLTGGANIYGYRGTITFDPSHLSFDSLEWHTPTGGFIQFNHQSDGIISLSGAGASPNGEEDIFGTLHFTVRPDFDATETTVSVDRWRWNENPQENAVASATLERVLGIGGQDGNMPLAYALHHNYPNPFNPTTTLRYDLPEPGFVHLTIYNQLGQPVRTLLNREESAGYKSIVWDARDNTGKQVSSGIYFYRIEVNGFTQTRKMVLLK